jgi:hypothetical protein
MDLVLDDNDTVLVRLMDDQLIDRLKRDVVDVKQSFTEWYQPRGGELFPETTIARTTGAMRSPCALGLIRPERSLVVRRNQPVRMANRTDGPCRRFPRFG